MSFQMEDFTNAKNTMENMNQWSTEVNKKAYETIAGRPLNESKPGLKGLVRRNLCR